MPDVITGRDDDVAALEAFLERARASPASLLLAGEAGSGKTTLWLAALERAGADTCVLSSRPVEAEAKLAFAGVGDLLAGFEEALGDLPEPQARALRIALMLESADSSPADERAVGLGLLGFLQALAAERPVLLAVDDLQWLDPSSARQSVLRARDRAGAARRRPGACPGRAASGPDDAERTRG